MLRTACVLTCTVLSFVLTIGTQAPLAAASFSQATDGDQAQGPWFNYDDSGELETGVTTPGSPGTSADAKSASTYTYTPPPDCPAQEIEELRTAGSDADLATAADALAGGCRAELGVWDAAQDCFVSLLTPPFEHGDPIWEGNTDGILIECLRPHVRSDAYVEGQGTVCANGTAYWSPTAPPGVPDPAALARQAVAGMQLAPIRIGLEPSKGPGIVGIPSWYWAQSPQDNEYGTMTASASAGGITVTARATTDHVTWNLNDETTLTCDQGTPYDPSLDATESDCSYRYQTQGDKHITATSTWTITWESGALGYQGTHELTLEDSAEADITIAEVQVINR